MSGICPNCGSDHSYLKGWGGGSCEEGYYHFEYWWCPEEGDITTEPIIVVSKDSIDKQKERIEP